MESIVKHFTRQWLSAEKCSSKRNSMLIIPVIRSICGGKNIIYIVSKCGFTSSLNLHESQWIKTVSIIRRGLLLFMNNLETIYSWLINKKVNQIDFNSLNPSY